MDEAQEITFANRDDTILAMDMDGTRDDDSTPTPDNNDKTPRRRGFRERLAALKDTASVQDRLIEKLLAQVVPMETGNDEDEGGDGGSRAGDEPMSSSRPGFNITTMSNNFRRFNSRIGVVFTFQAEAIQLFSWRQPTKTLCFLALYTFVCLDPYLLAVLPLAILLLGIMIPNFIVRHPAAPFDLSSEQAIGYSPRGPPLAPAVTVKPVKEFSRDFFHNMADLQNCMHDFTVLHDAVVSSFISRVNFSDETLSTAIFVLIFVACLVMTIAAEFLPWRFIFLGLGWAAVTSGHPTVARLLEAGYQEYVKPNEVKVQSWIERRIAEDIVLDSAPETREVEIFELQRLTDYDFDGTGHGGFETGEWEPWLFSPSPHDPLSVARLANERPQGTRFFEDVLPPPGWDWSEKKWTLDLWSREWVEERIITGVEVETEGERWVYDIYDGPGEDNVGVVGDHDAMLGEDWAATASLRAKGKGKGKSRASVVPRSGWEEGEEYEGRRGEWRRRRWVRMVKRKAMGTTSGSS